MVFVDGQPMMTDLFGLHLIELLPVSVADIDSVVFTRGPTIVDGRSNARGTVSIFTRQRAPGVSGELTYQHGDESGDPGTFRYTALSSPNLEKLGPFTHATLSYDAPGWGVNAALHYSSLNVTDTLIASRFPGVFSNLSQQVIAVSPTVRAHLRAHGTHTLIAAMGMQRGLMYIPSQAREQSLSTKLGNLSVGGTFDSLGAAAVRYSGGFQRMNVGELDSPLPFSVGHDRSHGFGALEAVFRTRGAETSVGVAGDDWRADRGAEQVGRSAERAFVRLGVPFGRRALDVTGILHHDDRGTSLDGAARVPMRFDSLTSVVLEVASVADDPVANGTWIDALVLETLSVLESSRLRISSAAITMRRLMAYLDVSVGAHTDRISGWHGAAILANGRPPSVDATLVGVTGHAALAVAGPIAGSIDISHIAFVAGDETLRVRGEAVPSDELRASLSAMPGEDFRISAALNLMASSTWVFPTPLDPSAVGTLDAITRLDASVEKWTWKRRLRLEVLARNLLNRPERYHPQGAQWNLRSHISASLQLP
jgi:hypothetical protein